MQRHPQTVVDMRTGYRHYEPMLHKSFYTEQFLNKAGEMVDKLLCGEWIRVAINPPADITANFLYLQQTGHGEDTASEMLRFHRKHAWIRFLSSLAE